jgi:hypothetical protein
MAYAYRWMTPLNGDSEAYPSKGLPAPHDRPECFSPARATTFRLAPDSRHGRRSFVHGLRELAYGMRTT